MHYFEHTLEERQPEIANALIYIPEWSAFYKADYYHWVGLAYFNLHRVVEHPHPDVHLSLIAGSIMNYFKCGKDLGILITTPPSKPNVPVRSYRAK